MVEQVGEPVTNGCADGVYHGSANAGMGTINFWVTVRNGQISGVTSGLTGITIGITWQQTNALVNGSSVTVSGIYGGTLGYEGIGAVWGYSSTYKITLPC